MERSIGFPHLNLGFDHVGKSLQIFGFEITIYGLLIAVGMLLAIAFVVLEAKRSNQNQDKYLNLVLVSLIGGVVGARLWYVLFSWNLYKGNFMEIFHVRNGGYAFYGGLLGGILAAVIFCRISKLDFWRMADTASMGILIGQIIGRWGNFFNRESFGEYTDSMFAMQLPLSAVRSGEVSVLMRENLITENGVSYIRVHPVFLYECLWCAVLLLFLLTIRRKKKFQGELFMIYLAGYGLGRFFTEWLRTDKLMVPGTQIGISLVVSAALFLVFAPVVWVKGVMSKKRAVARKLRKEKDYEAQENAYQESQGEEIREKEFGKPSENWENSASDQEKTEETTGSAPEEMQPEQQTEDSENWENSEYAHISRTWRTVPSDEGSTVEKTLQSSTVDADQNPSEGA